MDFLSERDFFSEYLDGFWVGILGLDDNFALSNRVLSKLRPDPGKACGSLSSF